MLLATALTTVDNRCCQVSIRQAPTTGVCSLLAHCMYLLVGTARPDKNWEQTSRRPKSQWFMSFCRERFLVLSKILKA